MAHERTDLCIDLQPQLVAYALGEAQADASLVEHIAGCPSCQRDLQAYARVARVLPHAAPTVTPPPELRARILAAVSPVPRVATPAAPPPTVQRSPWRRRMLRPAFAFACIALLALLGWNVSLQSRLNSQAARITTSRENWHTMTQLLNSPDVRAVALSGDQANGHLWISPQTNLGCLVAQGLPHPGNGKVYQVWLMQGNTPVSVATFEPQAGNAWIVLRLKQPVTSFAAVGVTIEPRGGSATPTGQGVLRGVLSVADAPQIPTHLRQLSSLAHPDAEY